ncbi:MAG: hypothetical protein EOO99_09870 [Pedobacter sp.]|nr:MAG: hypothetical protein EOO99_09870 [Pedobacter sp.]
MRIVAELPHAICKITIFKMGEKFIVKLEQGPYEQSYKISELNLNGNGVNDIFQFLDDEFMETVKLRFESMRGDFTTAYNRHM